MYVLLMSRGIKSDITLSRAQELHAEYAGGRTLAQVAEAHGLEYGTVRYCFEKFHFPLRKKGHRVKPTIRQSVDDSELLAFKAKWDALDSTVKGSIAEGYVRTKLAELKFDVWEPCSQNHRTDFVILSGKTATRIQVKCATYDSAGRRFRCNLQRRTRGGGFSVYEADDADFFVVYCAGLPALEFYVIPAGVVGASPSINLLPHREKQAVFYEFSWEKYRGAFHLLEAPHDAPVSVRPILPKRRRKAA